MYSRKKIPAPFGKTQKTAEKKKETTALFPKGNLKRTHFSSRGGKTMPQGAAARLCLHCCCWSCFPQKKSDEKSPLFFNFRFHHLHQLCQLLLLLFGQACRHRRKQSLLLLRAQAVPLQIIFRHIPEKYPDAPCRFSLCIFLPPPASGAAVPRPMPAPVAFPMHSFSFPLPQNFLHIHHFQQQPHLSAFLL